MLGYVLKLSMEASAFFANEIENSPILTYFY